jgi:hypothetical protein
MSSQAEEPFVEEEEDPAKAADAGHRDKLLQCKLYKILLEKYADLVNEKERRTIGEIKGLVNAEDLTVQSIIADFKGEEYSFQENYGEAAAKALAFVQHEINYVEPEINLNYWLSAKEIFSAKVGDDEDLSVFLCSLLLALGDEKAAVIIAELDNLKTHAFVATNYKGRFCILDPSQKHSLEKFSGKKEEALQKYSFKGAKIKRFLYKFNHTTYEQFM